MKNDNQNQQNPNEGWPIEKKAVLHDNLAGGDEIVNVDASALKETNSPFAQWLLPYVDEKTIATPKKEPSISETFSSAIKKEIEDNLESLVKEKAKKLLNSVVDSLFGRYGEITQQIERQMKDVFVLQKGVFDAYVDVMNKSIEAELNTHLQNQINKNLVPNVLGVIKEAQSIKTITLTGIIEKLMGFIVQDELKLDYSTDVFSDDFNYDISLHISERTLTTHIAIDSNPDVSRSDCEYNLSIDTSTGEIHRFKCEEKMVANMNGFQRFMHILALNGAKVLLDGHDEGQYRTNVSEYIN